MKSVCFIVDAYVTGAQLPRHLHAIYHASTDHPACTLRVTSLEKDNRLALIVQRFDALCIPQPALALGARLNHAAAASQAEWLIFALHATSLPVPLWQALFPLLDSYAVDAVALGSSEPTLPTRLLQRFLSSALHTPPYIAVRRTWLERLGGFDPELDQAALHDFLQRLHACPTRIHTFNPEDTTAIPGHIA
ncbi:hypothetical protein [Vreelandella arcis]|uniref:Uncharacterized protein n=1 Tax=Vreelandella arcis TaxID=416873 RepID=A0A1H0ALE4_9GAMM|nr:hypothetical protein [Halomonas arcis]SDN34402.1 hypothetical protein SAMN04487951_104162 [Halomonas arcis]